MFGEKGKNFKKTRKTTIKTRKSLIKRMKQFVIIISLEKKKLSLFINIWGKKLSAKSQSSSMGKI